LRWSQRCFLTSAFRTPVESVPLKASTARDLNAHVARRLVLTPPQPIATPTNATSSVVSLSRLDRIRDAYRLVVFNNILVSVDKKWLSHCEESTQLLDKVDKKQLVT
jgi:hypothetical protein